MAHSFIDRKRQEFEDLPTKIQALEAEAGLAEGAVSFDKGKSK